MSSPYWEPLAAAPLLVLPLTYGTSFPASPADGQEHILVDSITNPSYQWRFRYNASSTSAYKWEFIGGSHWQLIDGAQYTITPVNVWVGSTSTDFVVPRSGDYECTLTTQFGTPVVNTQCYIGVANASLSNNPSGGQWGIYVGNYDTITVIPILTGLVAGQTLRPVFQSPIANQTASFRTFRVVPRRCS